MEVEYEGEVEVICPKCKHKHTEKYSGTKEVEFEDMRGDLD